MPTPNPMKKVKGAGTTFWLYEGRGDAYADPLSDNGWTRLAGIKDLQPGEMTADEEDDGYLDDEDADWTTTAQGQKKAGDTTATLAWKPGEEGQKKIVALFDSGEVETWRIKYPNGTVDLFRGWISSLGKTVAAKDVITRSIKITGVGRPFPAEETAPPVVSVASITVDPARATVAAGETTVFTFTVKPDDATDPTLRIASSDSALATITQKDNVATVKGVKAGNVNIVAFSNDGNQVVIAPLTVQ